MAIVIGDIHGDQAMTRAFLDYKPEAEHVALGDYVDSRDSQTTPEDELATLTLLIESKSVLLWGNHDLTYLSPAPCFTDHRFPAIYEELNSIYESAASQNRFVAAHAVDGWLCTHAGLSSALTKDFWGTWECGDPAVIAEWLKAEFRHELVVLQNQLIDSLTVYDNAPLFKIGAMRGGNDDHGGIFWYDPRWEYERPDPRVKQIFGHTQTEGPMKKPTWVNIHIEGP